MKRARGVLAFVALAAAAAGCGSAVHPTPSVHRAVVLACPMTNTPGGLTCTTDADCSKVIAAATCQAGFCNFDQCTSDADCGGTNVCSCRGDTHGNAGTAGYRTCLQSKCRVDADCGPGGYCSPSVSSDCGPFFGIAGYFCHTPDDACTDDSECQQGSTKGYCAWQPALGHWGCGYTFCAG
jgi:hypothetical protein